METKKRIWEIDFLRGIAFLCMIYDHIIFDLNYIFGIKTIQLDFIGDFSAILFMILCGISTTFSRNSVKRGLIVFSTAMLLTAVTFSVDLLLNTKLIIVFGILHMLGIAMIISYFVKKMPNFLILVMAAVTYLLAIPLGQIKSLGNWLFAFGIHDNSFFSSDYYPIIPYISFVFIGIIIGKTIYKNKTSIFKIEIARNPISFLGRHSLFIYVIHQPVVLIILYIILKTAGII